MSTWNLPNFPLFTNIVQYATHENNVAIDDARMNTSFTYSQLVTAIVNLAEMLRGQTRFISKYAPCNFFLTIKLDSYKGKE